MLQITIPGVEMWDDENQQFVNLKEQTMVLEHSLVSISKWESKWHVPFLATKNKTFEQVVDYVKCMTITQNVNPDIYKYLTTDNIEEVNKYIDDPMTATTFSNLPAGKSSSEVLTNEVIYYQMTALNIPFKCEKWHLNRLLTLIKVCGIKSQPPKKMSRGEALRQQSAINAARKKRLNTRG